MLDYLMSLPCNRFLQCWRNPLQPSPHWKAPGLQFLGVQVLGDGRRCFRNGLTGPAGD